MELEYNCIKDLRLRFFFFQAEDGIRDTSVTGVQTCALPISSLRNGCDGLAGPFDLRSTRRAVAFLARDRGRNSTERQRRRSEERRVGKECRSRWWSCR